MAFKGHVNSDGEIVTSDEIFKGRTHISSLSFKQSQLLDQLEQSDHSDRSGSDSQEYNFPQQWDPPSNLQATSKMFYTNREESDDSPSSSPLSLPTAGSNNYANSKARTRSLYSITDLDTSLKHIKPDSDGVPSLDLRSNTLDYLRDVKSLKLHREPQVAYETWFAAKQRQRQRQLQLQKEKLEQEQLEKQERKQLAQLCYDQWLRDKARLAEERRVHNHMQLAALKAESSVPKVKRKTSSGDTERSVTQSEIRQVVQSWWMKKQQQQQRQRQEKQYYMKQKRREEQQRKQLAEKAFQDWISNVYEKPKPVPMNQGMDSLRGTISQIYVNPLPWEPLKKVPK